ncbi:MAG: hypothetical protein GY839_06320 [candidate division Zixibacteria bacterium]|nr:hypothetical protein [candidate division Zixibacteria bacterium]
MKKIIEHSPLLAALIIMDLVLVVLLILSWSKTQGVLTYILDDPYIHMAIAKNFALHGVWGVSPFEFASASSSLLWTLLIAGVNFVFGVDGLTPFRLNIIAASMLLVLIFYILKKHVVNKLYQLIVMLTVVFAAPLPSLIFCGQEHILHALLSVAIMYLTAKLLVSDDAFEQLLYGAKSKRRYEIWLLILAPLLTMTRYEGLFLVFVICVMFLFRKRFGFSVLLGGLALLPLVVFGLISVSKGWYFLPNSVLIKGSLPDLTSLNGLVLFLVRDIKNLFDVSALLILVIASIGLMIWHYQKDKKFWTESNILIALFLVTAWFHLQFADIGLFFRYEAYLVAMGIFAVAIAAVKIDSIWIKVKSLSDTAPGLIALAVIAIIIFYPLYLRGAYSSYFVPRSSANIYNQQYQVGRFLKRYYDSQPVVVNDIGAASFLGDIKTIDIWGLANMDAAQAIRSKQYTSEFIDVLAKLEKAQIAVVYDDIGRAYGMGGIPDNWHKVGWWTIPENKVCFNETVSFYAIDPAHADTLRQRLRWYAGELPAGVIWGVE